MSTRGGAALLGALGIGVLLMSQKKPTLPTSRPESRVDLLVPAFRYKVDQLMGLMRASGLKPLIWETYRPPERAAQLVNAGTGILHSQHELGLAVDIVDADKLWDPPQAFWDSLHRYALDLGLGRIKRRQKNGVLTWDWPHVQALPGRYDTPLRKLADAQAREAYLRTMYQV